MNIYRHLFFFVIQSGAKDLRSQKYFYTKIARLAKAN
jgi:hypothetical protein